MADNNKKRSVRKINQINRNVSANINSLLDQLSTMTGGTSQNTDVETMNGIFSDIMKSETDMFNHQNGRDTSTFISDLFKDSKDIIYLN